MCSANQLKPRVGSQQGIQAFGVTTEALSTLRPFPPRVHVRRISGSQCTPPLPGVFSLQQNKQQPRKQTPLQPWEGGTCLPLSVWEMAAFPHIPEGARSKGVSFPLLDWQQSEEFLAGESPALQGQDPQGRGKRGGERLRVPGPSIFS